MRWRGLAASLLLHAALIAVLLGLWRPRAPVEPPPPRVAVILEKPGAEGATGGGATGAPQTGTAAAAGGATSAAAPAPQPAATAAAPTPILPQPPHVAPTKPVVAAVPPPLPSRKPRPPQPVKRVRSQPPVAPPPRPVVAAAPPELPSPAPPAPASAPATAASTTGGATASGSAGATGQGAGQGQGSEGAGHGVIGAGPVAGPGDDYLEALQRWLSKYKRYPAAALKKKEEGQAVVGFTLKRDGTVLSAWIVRSSGVPALDAAALELMHRASPVPPVPARYQGSELKLAIPVNYSIGFFDRMFR